MLSDLTNSSVGRLRRWNARRHLRAQIAELERVVRSSPLNPDEGPAPVFFFDASTRLNHVSQNAAFSKLAEWAVRQMGVQTWRLVCQQGMSQCMLGTDHTDLEKPPPCRLCLRMSGILHALNHTLVLEFDPGLESDLRSELDSKSIAELSGWRYQGYELGQICLPSLRWALRRHHLPEESGIRDTFRRYLTSAANLLHHFGRIFDALEPRALVVFNGVSYPEAVARQVALSKGVPVVTHEVGMRPISAFFSHGHATAYPIEPPRAALRPDERRALDAYLQDRTRGRFSMAGVKFWPEIEPLPETLREKMDVHRGTVPVFTNVIFDTSQIHANLLFENMFDWLEELKRVISAHPETLFVIRAHPDEARPGKTSQESVANWVADSGLLEAENLHFIPATEYVSSYDLIREAKLVLIYNSSIGLEASILGVPVLCAGRARFTGAHTVYFPDSKARYKVMLETFLAQERVENPEEFSENARRFLHYQLFRTSLVLSDFLRPDPDIAGGVLLKGFEIEQLAPERSAELDVIAKGILYGSPFVYPEGARAHMDQEPNA
jgi:hypothetical protein